MDSFVWAKHFETELPEVDRQHRQLVDLINQFGTLSAANQLVFDDIRTIFIKLTDYAQSHFREEELLMQSSGVDRRFQRGHIEAHRNFLQDVSLMRDEFSPDNPDAARFLLEFLTHWLAYHVLGTDQKMARQIQAIRAGIPAADAYEAAENQDDRATRALLGALSTLLQMVSARNKELVQLNMSLEAEVAKRTAALSDANRHLEELALTDVLTGLPNRRHAMRSLADRWQESLTTGAPLVCTMVDADNFKTINDRHGHAAGDFVLCELAKTLQHAFRSDDIVCRLGGDEFLIICPNTDLDGGFRIAERTRKMVSALRVAAGNGAWHGSVSAGVAARTPGMKHYEDLIKVADNAVYLAKQDGRNCVRTIV